MINGTAQYIQLLLACQLNKVNGIAADADGKLRILLGVLHSINQKFAVKHVHIQVLATIRSKVTVHQVHQILSLSLAILTQCTGADSEGV